MDELRRISGVGQNASNLRSSEYDKIRALLVKKVPHSCLIGQIEFGMGACDDFSIACFQPTQNSTANHAAVTGNVDFAFHAVLPFDCHWEIIAMRFEECMTLSCLEILCNHFSAHFSCGDFRLPAQLDLGL